VRVAVLLLDFASIVVVPDEIVAKTGLTKTFSREMARQSRIV
jgi:hypothetical protein